MVTSIHSNGKKGTKISNYLLPNYQPLSLWEEKKTIEEFLWREHLQHPIKHQGKDWCKSPLLFVALEGRHSQRTFGNQLVASTLHDNPPQSLKNKSTNTTTGNFLSNKNTTPPKTDMYPKKVTYIYISTGKYIFQLPTIDFQSTCFKVFRMLCIYKGSKSQRLSMKQTHDASLQTWGRRPSRWWFHGTDRTKSQMEPQAIE